MVALTGDHLTSKGVWIFVWVGTFVSLIKWFCSKYNTIRNWENLWSEYLFCPLLEQILIFINLGIRCFSGKSSPPLKYKGCSRTQENVVFQNTIYRRYCKKKWLYLNSFILTICEENIKITRRGMNASGRWNIHKLPKDNMKTGSFTNQYYDLWGGNS